ncbi:MAG: lysine--tRNA ligase, partial [Endozoicomonas sp.]
MSEQQIPEEQNVDAQEENRLVALRREKLTEIRSKRVAFPNKFRRDALAGELQQQFEKADKVALAEQNHRVSVAGRIMLNRGAFMELQDMSGRIQLYVNRKQLSKETLAEVKTWDLGDIIGVEGTVQRSGKGDLYVDMEAVQLLTKSLRPLPEKHKGLTDTEQRYRQRYVDLITNEQSRGTFRVRSRIIQGIREYFHGQDFMEVETPMLQVIPGGATARPFVTHHNALDIDMYLRIAPELYLKRVVVGGFERVFEINRNFRNEGLSTRHNPEFTMIEFYQAYADYSDMMDHTEAMLKQLAQDVLGKTEFEYQGQRVDFGQPFARMSVFDSILHYNPDLEAGDIDHLESATQVARKLGIEVKEIWGLGKVQMEIFDETVEHHLLTPTFITDYPTEVSPLSRRNDENSFVTERFEFFVGGREIANG